MMDSVKSASATPSTSSSTETAKYCIICSENASEKIVKDKNFQMMMDLYWNSIRVDVKPDMNKGFNLCINCFDNILQYYQINDVLVYFESRLKELQRNIIATNLKGVLTWQEKGFKLHRVQSQIMQEWGTKLEAMPDSEANKAILDKYQVSLSHEDDKDSSSTVSGGASVDRQSKKGHATPGRKPFNSSEPPTGKGQKRKKMRRGRSGDRESDESDGSNFSDNTRVIITSDDEAVGARSSRRSAVSAEVVSKPPETEASTSTVFSDRECKICLDKFDSFSNFQKHLRQHKVGENDGKYECRKCMQQFNRQPKLIEHKKSCSTTD